MNCPNCNSENVTTAQVTEWFPYGDDPQAFQVTLPTMTCVDCSFGWRDHRAEMAIESAMQEYEEANEVPNEDRVGEFSEKVRALLADYIGDSAGVKEAYREALLLLAAEL